MQWYDSDPAIDYIREELERKWIARSTTARVSQELGGHIDPNMFGSSASLLVTTDSGLTQTECFHGVAGPSTSSTPARHNEGLTSSSDSDDYWSGPLTPLSECLDDVQPAFEINEDVVDRHITSNGIEAAYTGEQTSFATTDVTKYGCTPQVAKKLYELRSEVFKMGLKRDTQRSRNKSTNLAEREVYFRRNRTEQRATRFVPSPEQLANPWLCPLCGYVQEANAHNPARSLMKHLMTHTDQVYPCQGHWGE